ncbi:MAG TPA: helix-turn-helix domain-containing protein [Vitreimonas sp.]|jgi:AraC-like DNA-binding protein|nr:helix-turn-helix domain-containing protein [Vitreimonas sp.]
MATLGAEPNSARLWLRGQDVSSLFANVANGDVSVVSALASGASDRVALADYFRMSRKLAFAAREESLGIAPRPLVSGTTDFVIAQAARQPTLGDAMSEAAAAYNRLHGGAYNSVAVNSDGFAFRIDDRTFPYPDRACANATFMMECVLINLHALACTLAGEDLTHNVIRVETRRAQALDAGPLDFWTCPVIYGAQAFALVYASPLAHHRLAGGKLHEEAVHDRVLALIEKREHGVFGAALAVRQVLRDGVCDQHDAARRLGMSVATLRRKLAHEGLSFRQLRQEILNERAHARLLSRAKIADVADDLGFSDSRSFARAFKTWNGATPRAFRTRSRSH